MVALNDLNRLSKIAQSREDGGNVGQKKLLINVISDGITRLPILDGEISHIEIPRGDLNLGMSIVGGADTPLRCVVIQEIFPDGVVSKDGRLQAGDQIVEVDGVDMTAASHHAVCASLRESNSLLKLAIYRERIDSYKTSSSPYSTNSSSSSSSRFFMDDLGREERRIPGFDFQPKRRGSSVGSIEKHDLIESLTYVHEEIVSVDLVKESKGHRQLGLKLGQLQHQSGLYVIHVTKDSIADDLNRIRIHDRIISINGQDMKHGTPESALRYIQRIKGKIISFVLGRSKCAHLTNSYIDNISQDSFFGCEDRILARDEYSSSGFSSGVSDQNSECSNHDEVIENVENPKIIEEPSMCPTSELERHLTSSSSSFSALIDNPDLSPIFNSFLSVEDSSKFLQQHHPATILDPHRTSPIFDNGHFPSIEESSRTCAINQNLNSAQPLPLRPIDANCHNIDFDLNLVNIATQSSYDCCRQRRKLIPPDPDHYVRSDNDETSFGVSLNAAEFTQSRDRELTSDNIDIESSAFPLRKVPQLEHKEIHLKKLPCESLGMRIGGGVDSNEGDTPIYIANINQKGPAGRRRKIKKGDILLSINGQPLHGLTHSQAVSLIKSSAEVDSVTLSLFQGPETSEGPSNFIPSWMFFQCLPRSLQLSKCVVLHRAPGTSLGFSIVGGSDPERGYEPIHVLFVVRTSPAALDGRLRCGDQLLRVDGRNLDSITHSQAVQMLKQAGQRVSLEVVSWMGTEI